ncbi:hypothetical protein A8144_02400 [Mycobacterium leprae 3125609]|nr:hypothetical protein A8144_02400 [Mycobacterium leprae 3125609]OAX72048.1 hypothetical protein A3216_02390 [Mycobacterium leprae 7935681]
MLPTDAAPHGTGIRCRNLLPTSISSLDKVTKVSQSTALRAWCRAKTVAISDMLMVCKLLCELSIRHRRPSPKRHAVQPGFATRHRSRTSRYREAATDIQSIIASSSSVAPPRSGATNTRLC